MFSFSLVYQSAWVDSGQEGGMGWWMDRRMEGGWVQSSPPLALLCCHLLPHSRPEVVGVLLTCNPSHCLAAGSRVTCQSFWHESALTPADLSYFSQSVNRAWDHGPLANKKKIYYKTPSSHSPPPTHPKLLNVVKWPTRAGIWLDIFFFGGITSIKCEMTIRLF